MGSALDLKLVKALTDQIAEHLSGLPKASAPAVSDQLTLITKELRDPTPDHSKIRSALDSIRRALEGAAGNLLASGILAELARLLH
jgi:hypothetical protein